MVAECLVPAVTEEVLRCETIARAAAGNASRSPARHPANAREGHFQCLLFHALRSVRYYTRAETNYCDPSAPSRQLDLALWMPDSKAWLFVEIEKCGSQGGDDSVIPDAIKLIEDVRSDPAACVRLLLVYGFLEVAGKPEKFRTKYDTLGQKLTRLGYLDGFVLQRHLPGESYCCFQVGCWVVSNAARPTRGDDLRPEMMPDPEKG
jgi:hypothetical protein